jgi:hypothetical protein
MLLDISILDELKCSNNILVLRTLEDDGITMHFCQHGILLYLKNKEDPPKTWKWHPLVYFSGCGKMIS